MIVEELTVTKVMLLNPVPLPPAVPTVAPPEMKIEPAPEVSKVIVVVAADEPEKLKGAGSTQCRINRDGQPDQRLVVKEAALK